MLDWVVLNASTVATKTASIECCNVLVSDFCLKLTQNLVLEEEVNFYSFNSDSQGFQEPLLQI